MKHLKGFTLVELIVVITIVGILSTVWFVSYSSYLMVARDSNRISQMIKLNDSLQVYSATKSLPLPDNKIDITASWTVFAYQGYAWVNVLETIDYTNGGLDPKDKIPYTYFVSANRNFFQLLVFMEENQSVETYITQSYAIDYNDRYPKVYWNKLGILTDINNTPLQELTITGSNLNITTTTLNLKSFLTDTQFLTWTGTKLSNLPTIISQKGKHWSVENNTLVYNGTEEQNGTTNTPSRYPGCNMDDITLWSFIIAACNVWSTIAGTWTLSYWRLFQWGENISWDTATGTGSSNNCNWNRDTQSCWTSALSSWLMTVSDTVSWWSERWFDYGDTRGPCALWYRLPSSTEWSSIVTTWWWGNNWVSMRSILLIPFSWGRFYSAGTWSGGWSFAHYWSSTPSTGSNATNLYISSSSIFTSLNARTDGDLVRCIKN